MSKSIEELNALKAEVEKLKRKPTMEKITKEELLEKLGDTALSDKELEDVAGGGRAEICQERADQKYDGCMAQFGLKSKCEKQRQQTFDSCMNA